MTGRDKVRTARLVLVAWFVAWPLFHVGLAFLPPWFFEHVLVGLSVYAVVATKQDDYHTVRAAAETKAAAS